MFICCLWCLCDTISLDLSLSGPLPLTPSYTGEEEGDSTEPCPRDNEEVEGDVVSVGQSDYSEDFDDDNSLSSIEEHREDEATSITFNSVTEDVSMDANGKSDRNN